ncbi:MAG: hypothetical protein IT250_13210 [Chitinophagaceae bacterium]|nr:hypothetical protein [Chitinophagaceae bacterium]
MVQLNAMSDKGFAKPTEKMKAAGIPVSPKPDIQLLAKKTGYDEITIKDIIAQMHHKPDGWMSISIS